MPTTSSLRSSAPWGARPATGLRCPFADCTIVSCTGAATSASGGKTRGLTLYPLRQPFGLGRMRSHPPRRRSRTTETGRPGSTQGSTDIILATELPPALIGVKTTKRSQFVARRQGELVSANRGQSPQCASEHRSRHRRGQEKVAASGLNYRRDRIRSALFPSAEEAFTDVSPSAC
jgi:hypothetical protein